MGLFSCFGGLVLLLSGGANAAEWGPYRIGLEVPGRTSARLECPEALRERMRQEAQRASQGKPTPPGTCARVVGDMGP
jgi:hypothetical protein